MIFTYQSSADWGGGAGGRILDRERERETERRERLGISTLCMCLLVD